MANAVDFVKGLAEKALVGVAVIAQAVHQVVTEAYDQGYQDGRQDGRTKSYEEGFRAGASAMRESLLRAAQEPLAVPEIPSRPVTANGEHHAAQQPADTSTPFRAPRGSVRVFVVQQLRTNPGQTEYDLKQIAEETEQFSSSSVGNELRRNENHMYERDDENRWFLIPSSTESAGASARTPHAHDVSHHAA